MRRALACHFKTCTRLRHSILHTCIHAIVTLHPAPPNNPRLQSEANHRSFKWSNVNLGIMHHQSDNVSIKHLSSNRSINELLSAVCHHTSQSSGTYNSWDQCYHRDLSEEFEESLLSTLWTRPSRSDSKAIPKPNDGAGCLSKRLRLENGAMGHEDGCNLLISTHRAPCTI